MQIKKIVFVIPWPLDEIYEKKFGLSFLRAEGFKIKYLDLSVIMGPGNLAGPKIKTPEVITPQSYTELSQTIKVLAKDAVFIDYIVGTSEISCKSVRLFRLLKKHNAQYAVVAAGALPLPGLTTRRIKKVLSPCKAANYLFRNACGYFRKHKILFPLPEFIFGGAAETTSNFIKKYSLNPQNIIPINSFDYNAYLEFGKNNPAPAQENICVFIDEAITDHRDYEYLGLKPVRAENYFPHLNSLFDRIEKITGLKVIVAAHPNSSYEKMAANPFGARPVVKFRTIELVAKSRLVVAHASTAVNFAVLFNKPILFAKVLEMDINWSAVWVSLMAEILGLRVFDIDKGQPSDVEILSYKNWSLAGYEDYKYKYIKSRNAPELSVHEIMAAEFKKTWK